MKNRGDYFNTEAKFWSWYSSQLRRAWCHHPTKLDFIKSKRYLLQSGIQKLYHVDCAICGEPTLLKNVEVNHKLACGNIKEDGYANRMFNVGYTDLECLCKPCHAIVTYSERQGLSFEEAKLEKKVVEFGKLTAKDQKALLGEDSKAKNEKERKDEYRQILKEKQNG